MDRLYLHQEEYLVASTDPFVALRTNRKRDHHILEKEKKQFFVLKSRKKMSSKIYRSNRLPIIHDIRLNVSRFFWSISRVTSQQ